MFSIFSSFFCKVCLKIVFFDDDFRSDNISNYRSNYRVLTSFLSTSMLFYDSLFLVLTKLISFLYDPKLHRLYTQSILDKVY